MSLTSYRAAPPRGRTDAARRGRRVGIGIAKDVGLVLLRPRRMDMRKLVGRNVKRIRQEKGLTKEQCAEISGFSQQYLSSLERGRRNPTVVTVYEVATALGVSHIDLV